MEQSFTVNVKNHNVYALYSNLLLVFFRSMPIIFLFHFFGSLARGPPGARGPRFIKPPESPVATPLHTRWLDFIFLGVLCFKIKN